MKLRSNEPCPIHRSLFCCGREQMRRLTRLNPGVRRVEDPHHSRGYRELRSSAEMRRLLNRKIVEQDRKCAICHEEFTDYNDVVPDHKEPKGMGGAWRDDHPTISQRTAKVILVFSSAREVRVPGRNFWPQWNAACLKKRMFKRLAPHSCNIHWLLDCSFRSLRTRTAQLL